MNYSRREITILLIVSAFLGSIIGYRIHGTFVPPKVTEKTVVVEKIVEVEKIKANVVTRIVKRPDGTTATKIVDRTETSKNQSSEVIRVVEKSNTVSAPKPLNSFGVTVNPFSYREDFSATYGRRLFDSSVWLEGSYVQFRKEKALTTGFKYEW